MPIIRCMRSRDSPSLIKACRAGHVMPIPNVHTAMTPKCATKLSRKTPIIRIDAMMKVPSFNARK